MKKNVYYNERLNTVAVTFKGALIDPGKDSVLYVLTKEWTKIGLL